MQAPVPLKLHCPPDVQEHIVPVQLAGTPAVPPPEDPHADASDTPKTAARKKDRFMVDFFGRVLSRMAIFSSSPLIAASGAHVRGPSGDTSAEVTPPNERSEVHQATAGPFSTAKK